MVSVTKADLLCEERATTMVGGRSFLLLYRINETIFVKREKVKKKSRKAEKNVSQQATRCNTNIIG